ncbi:MAG TPA: amidohydrolase [Steroidobacteraceae bacterium]|nr:amidohydrolase [Steroidobacteraceae bacterium]
MGVLHIAVLASSLLAVTTAASGDASLVLVNGIVHTGISAAPPAEAVVSTGGRIVYVGSTQEALERAPAGARTIDLEGATVLPGLADAHAHLAGIGWRELHFDLTGVESLAALQQRIRERAASDPSPWIVGRGWIESGWSPAVFPVRTDLDAVVTSRPVMLERADGHAVIVNSRALEIAGITAATPDPPGGEILRDPRTGEPTGMLVDAAVDLVQQHVPAPTAADLRRALEAGARRSLRLGWTQLQVAGMSWEEIDELCRLYADGRVALRVYAAIGGPGPDAERLLAAGRSFQSCDPRLTVRSVKLYMDGALGSRGAALLEPYSDAPASRGLLRHAPEEILRITIAGLRSGIQVQTHAIGDRGNRIVLDQYRQALASVPVGQRAVADPRLRIEHLQVIDDADIPRLAQMGVIASMQPSHAISDMLFAPARLGRERLGRAYAWRKVLDAGAVLAGGSDAPVEQGDPLVEFYAAVARRTVEGFAGPEWGLDQRLTRAEALAALTTGPAYAAFEEGVRGTIEPGKWADLSVFSADLMSVPEAAILKARAVMTVIGGEVAWSAAEPTRPSAGALPRP